MSSFTSAVSLRRKCFIPSSDQDYIIGAHGPFLESINVSEWEQSKNAPDKQPVRVKLFENACIDTVLPLGTTGHVIAISEFVQDSPGEDYKVYASVVHKEDLVEGGYRRNRFVISTQPASEKPTQPAVAVTKAGNKMLVLTRQVLSGFEIIFYTTNEGKSAVMLKENSEIFQSRKELSLASNPFIPLFMSAQDRGDTAFALNSTVYLLSFSDHINQRRDKNIHPFTLQIEVENEVTASLGIQDMKIALIAAKNVLYVLSTMIKKREVPGKRVKIYPIAMERTEEQIVQISASDRQTPDVQRTVATMASTCIRLWGLTTTSLTARGFIDVTGSPLTACALIARCVEVTTPATSAAAAVAACSVPPSTYKQKTADEKIDEVVEMLFDTLDAHSCTKTGGTVKRCPFGDCLRVRELAEHLEECADKECTYDRVEVDRTRKLIETITQLSADMKKKKNREKINNRAPTVFTERKEYDLLVVATEDGQVKFIDPAAYSTPSLQLLPTQPNDIVNSDVVAFCPAWTDYSKGGGGGLMDNLFGIYGLSSQGQHFFRSYSGPDNRIVSTTVIANDIIDLASFVAPWGTTTVVAYGKKSIHLSAHRTDWKNRMNAHLITSFAPILQCFVHSNHFVVCTKQRMVFMATWSLLHHKETRGVSAKAIELEGGETITAYEALYCKTEDGDDLRLSIVGTSLGRIFSMKPNDNDMDGMYDNLQHMIDSPGPRQFVLDKNLTKKFRGNEIVSISSHQKVVDTTFVYLLGKRGDVLRCKYTPDKGLQYVWFDRSDDWSLIYRPIVPVVGRGKEEYLRIAHNRRSVIACGNGSGDGVMLTEIHLVGNDLKSLMQLQIEMNKHQDTARCDDVFVHRLAGGGWDAVGVLTLHRGKPSKKKTNKDSIACVEGTLKLSKHETDVVHAFFEEGLRAVYTTSTTDASVKRWSSVLGVTLRGFAYLSDLTGEGVFDNRSIWYPDDETDMKYQWLCCDYLWTPDSAYLLYGCLDGGVMLLQLVRDGRSYVSDGFEEIIVEESAIDQISIFNRTAIDIREKKEMMFGVLTQGALIVFTVSLDGDEGEKAINCIATCEVEGGLDGFTLIALGSLQYSHDIWLFGETEMGVWRGRKGEFEKEEEVVMQSTGLSGCRSAVAAITVQRPDPNNNNNGVCSIDLFCVSTECGDLGLMYSGQIHGWSPHRIGRIEMESVEGTVNDLALEACEHLRQIDAKTVEFGFRLYILTARRVSIQHLRLTLTGDSQTIQQISHLHLIHLVRNPMLLSIEPMPLPIPAKKKNKKKKKAKKEEETKKKDLPQRLIVTGGREYEVLLFCPKKIEGDKKPVPSSPSSPLPSPLPSPSAVPKPANLKQPCLPSSLHSSPSPLSSRPSSSRPPRAINMHEISEMTTEKGKDNRMTLCVTKRNGEKEEYSDLNQEEIQSIPNDLVKHAERNEKEDYGRRKR